MYLVLFNFTFSLTFVSIFSIKTSAATGSEELCDEELREAESNGRLKVMSLTRCLFSIPLYRIVYIRL